ncbi:hypothetical protein FRX31_012169, partial [Thalictrum thalictroides]
RAFSLNILTISETGHEVYGLWALGRTSMNKNIGKPCFPCFSRCANLLYIRHLTKSDFDARSVVKEVLIGLFGLDDLVMMLTY